MKIINIYSRDYRSNTFLAVSGRYCAVIDPGAAPDNIISEIQKYDLIPELILLTHGHFDHIFSLDYIREKFSIPAYIHEADAEMLTDSVKNAYSFFFRDHFKQKNTERTFVGGDKIKIGDEFLTVIHTPGHSKGSSCFACDDLMITGDTLFAQGFGRTDLHGGNASALLNSLNQMRKIDNGTKITIYPGHGECSILSHALDNILY